MKRKDDAVSPVIATILLVAVVVVLVAVIAAAVLPMAGDLGTVKSVSVTVGLNADGTLPVVTVIGGADAGMLTNLTVYVSGVSDAVIDETKPIVVGKPYSPTTTGLDITDGQHTVNVVGTFSDSTTQTLYTGTLVFR